MVKKGYFKKGQYPGDIIEKAQSVNSSGSLITKSKYTVRGAIAGAVIGWIGFKLLRKKGWIGLLVGTFGGALAGNMYSKLEDKIKIIQEYGKSNSRRL